MTRFGMGIAVGVLLVLPAGQALAQDTSLSVSGSAAQEVPGPGEEGSTVTGQFTFDEAAGTITYTVSVAGNSEPVAAAHLHEAPAGEAGDPVVPLDAAAVNAGTEATVTVDDPALVAEIVANPADYYLNVHSASFPAGFARAQLAGSAPSESAPSSVPAGDGSSSGSSVLIGTVLLGSGAAVVAAGVARRRRGATT
jgi:hypothetical protein